MKLGLGIKIGTSLALTPQLQQAIRILQLSNLELAQEVQKELDQNPLLERIEADTYPTDTPAEPSSEGVQNDNPKSDTANQTESALATQPEVINSLDKQMANEGVGKELAVDTQWEDVYIHESTKWDKPASTDFDVYQGQTTDSLQTHISWQMNLARLSPVDQLICERMIDSLDDNGFLGISLEDLHNNMQAELAFAGIDYDLELIELETVLKRIQQCEPVGVAARNLAESLMLQLNVMPEDTPYLAEAKQLMCHHELLVKNDLKKLLKAAQLSVDDVQAAMALIRTLDPYPASDFGNNEVSYQIPDVLVSSSEVGLSVRLNPDTLPKLRINNTYASMITRSKKSDAASASANASSGAEATAKTGKNNNAQQSSNAQQANEYLKNNLNNAKQFIRGIDERNKSLLTVASAIVEKQHAFFEQGETAMKPLVLREIADMVDLHESTVSRITTNKYMLTPLGLFELKYFFSSHVSTDAGGECSSTAICAMIKEIIESEDAKKPLSDNAITKLLQNKGIDVARRTVAKYRESLGFASSSNRKRLL